MKYGRGSESTLLKDLLISLDKEFKNIIVKKASEDLKRWIKVSESLFTKYSDIIYFKTRGKKERFLFNNKYPLLGNKSGEYLMLTNNMLHLFSRGTLSTIKKERIPILYELKILPCFWINNGFIVAWNFYFSTDKVYELLLLNESREDKKIISFQEIEVSQFNFIETYSSKLEYVDIDERKISSTYLDRYLTRNFWIIPNNDIRTINPFCMFLLSGHCFLPCTPFRIIFRIIKFGQNIYIKILSKSFECVRAYIEYLNSRGEIRRCEIYIPTSILDKDKIKEHKLYNGLIFSLISFDKQKEWIYPILFSLYEEDLHGFEIFQEILLLIFKKYYLLNDKVFIVNIDEKELLKEVRSLANKISNKMIIFPRGIDEKGILDLAFSKLSNLYPMLLKNGEKVIYIPPFLFLFFQSLGKGSPTFIIEMVEILEEHIKKFIEVEESKEKDRIFLDLGNKLLNVLKEYIKIDRNMLDSLVRDFISRYLFFKYIKEVEKKLIGEENLIDKN